MFFNTTYFAVMGVGISVSLSLMSLCLYSRLHRQLIDLRYSMWRLVGTTYDSHDTTVPV